MTASEKVAIEAELEASAKVRGRLAQLRQIREAVSAPEPALEAFDLPAAVQAALRRPAPDQAHRNSWLAAAMGAAALAASLLIVCFGLPGDSGREFRARALGEFRARALGEFRAKSLGTPSAPERWAGVQVYRLSEDGRPEPLGDRLSASDGLLFAYSNLGLTPFEYLMIFARSSTGHVYWFYPAYERADTDPASTPLEAGQAHLLLAEVIRHDYEPGPLSIYALFSRRPLRVSAVEAWLERTQGVAVPADDSHLQVVTTRVSQ